MSAHAVEVFSKYGGAFRIRHLAQHHDFLETARDGGKGTFRCSAYRDQRKLGHRINSPFSCRHDFLLRNGEQASACSRRDRLKFSWPVCAVQGDIAVPRGIGVADMSRRTLGIRCGRTNSAERLSGTLPSYRPRYVAGS